MTDRIHPMLSGFHRQHVEAMEILHQALTCPDPGPAERLMRWMLAPQDLDFRNPFTVFVDPKFGRRMFSAEGAAGVLMCVKGTFEGDGEISFPVTAFLGPKIAFVGREDARLQEHMFHMAHAHGHGDDVIAGHRVTGFCDDVDVFMKAFDDYGFGMKAEFDEFLRP